MYTSRGSHFSSSAMGRLGADRIGERPHEREILLSGHTAPNADHAFGSGKVHLGLFTNSNGAACDGALSRRKCHLMHRTGACALPFRKRIGRAEHDGTTADRTLGTRRSATVYHALRHQVGGQRRHIHQRARSQQSGNVSRDELAAP